MRIEMPNLLKFKQLQYLFFSFSFFDFASAELMVDKTCIGKGLFFSQGPCGYQPHC